MLEHLAVLAQTEATLFFLQLHPQVVVEVVIAMRLDQTAVQAVEVAMLEVDQLVLLEA